MSVALGHYGHDGHNTLLKPSDRAAMTEPKQPPVGVETTPTGDVVSVQHAASRLGKNARTLKRWIEAGTLRGGAMPRQERLRWYVYVEELERLAPSPAPKPPQGDPYVSDLQAQLVSQMEANRLLIAAQQDLLDANRSTAESFNSAARKYLDALSQFMTPGHLGELSREL